MRYMCLPLIFSLFVACNSCDKSEQADPNPSDPQPFVATYDLDDLTTDLNYTNGKVQGGVDYIAEASGLAASHSTPGYIWSHNDGGGNHKLFLLNIDSTAMHIDFDFGVSPNLDWEDIACSYHPGSDKSYLYIADVGDNFKSRSFVTIHKFEEPVYDSNNVNSLDINKEDVTTINFKYPDGQYNCEAMLVDPAEQDIYVVSKEGFSSSIYRVPHTGAENSLVTAVKLGTIPFPSVTAADFSPDGQLLVMRNYSRLLIWYRNPWESVSDLLQKPPLELPYNGLEAQGEAISISEEGYYTISEKTGNETPDLYFYPTRP